MSPENEQTMTDASELDAQVHREVMGLDEPCACETMAITDEDGVIRCAYCWKVKPKHYSTDIAAAWEVGEKMQELGFTVSILVHHDGQHVEVSLTKDWWNREDCDVVRKEATAPIAVCRAALAAVRSQPPASGS